MARIFRPRTGLTVFDSLEATIPTSVELSQKSAYDLHWTQIVLPGRSPPDNRCCGACNPGLLARFTPSSPRDHRLHQFAAEFILSIAEQEEHPPLRPTSPSSAMSDGVYTRTVGVGLAHIKRVSVRVSFASTDQYWHPGADSVFSVAKVV
jgi:hypothetical protein